MSGKSIIILTSVLFILTVSAVIIVKNLISPTVEIVGKMDLGKYEVTIQKISSQPDMIDYEIYDRGDDTWTTLIAYKTGFSLYYYKETVGYVSIHENSKFPHGRAQIKTSGFLGFGGSSTEAPKLVKDLDNFKEIAQIAVEFGGEELKKKANELGVELFL